MSKPVFTEEEINQLADLHDMWGNECGISDSIRIIDILKCPYKDIASFKFLLKKELEKKRYEYRAKYQEKYKNSITLDNKLQQRLEWTDKNKPKEL